MTARHPDLVAALATAAAAALLVLGTSALPEPTEASVAPGVEVRGG